MGVKEIECEVVHWIELIQDISFAVFCALGNDLRVSLGMENFFSRPSTMKFWRSVLYHGIVYFLEYRLIYFYYSRKPDEIWRSQLLHFILDSRQFKHKSCFFSRSACIG
jgi:hypothetical protein